MHADASGESTLKKRRLLHGSGWSLFLAILSACGGSASTDPAPGDAAEDPAGSDAPGASAEPQPDVDASRWRVSETASTTSSVAQLAIMVDAEGTPHIAHNGGIGTSGGLRHAWLVNGELTEEVIDDNSRGWQKSWVAGAPEPRLVYDSNHLFEPVSYEASRDPSGAWTVGTFSFLHHVAASSGVWRDSGSWVVRQAAERRDAYFQGQPAVAVLHGVLFDVQLAATGGVHYGREEVTPGLALALDRSGKAHVIYSAPSDELADFPNSASLAGAADVDKRSELVMYTVRYLTLGDSGWSEPETLTPSEGWYHGLSMAIDDQDNVHVAFSGASEFVPSDSEYDLRFASTITHLQRAPDSAWVREDVSTSGSPQLARGSLALSPNGDPELVYYSRPSAERGEVTYARKQGSTWTTELIQAGCARHGAGATLALDPAGTPHVGYRSCDGTLIYATRPAP